MIVRIMLDEKDDKSGIVTVRGSVLFRSDIDVDVENIRTPHDHREMVKSVKKALVEKLMEQVESLEPESLKFDMDAIQMSFFKGTSIIE